MRPRKRSRPRRSPRVTLTRRVTSSVAPTVSGVLTMSGRATICTLNCVFTGTDRTGTEKLPSALVTSSLPTGRNPCVYGHGLLLTMIRRSGPSVPDSTPASVVAPPAATGFGVAANEKPSGTFLVLNVRCAAARDAHGVLGDQAVVVRRHRRQARRPRR